MNGPSGYVGRHCQPAAELCHDDHEVYCYAYGHLVHQLHVSDRGAIHPKNSTASPQLNQDH